MIAPWALCRIWGLSRVGHYHGWHLCQVTFSEMPDCALHFHDVLIAWSLWCGLNVVFLTLCIHVCFNPGFIVTPSPVIVCSMYHLAAYLLYSLLGRVFVLEMQNVSETGYEWARQACATHNARLASASDLWHAILECSFSVCTRGWIDGATVG